MTKLSVAQIFNLKFGVHKWKMAENLLGRQFQEPAF